MCRRKGYSFLRHFGVKTSIDFPNFGPGIGYGFPGNSGSVSTYLSFHFQNSNGFYEIFLLELWCKNDDLISTYTRFDNQYGFRTPGLKTGLENSVFWSEIGSGFGEPGGTPPPKIP